MKRGLLTMAIACALAGPALAQEASISLSPTGELIARGAAARISATVQCSAGYQGYVGADCSQRVGARLAGSSGGNELTCSGGTQTVDILLRPYNDRPFGRGDLACNAYVSACTQDYSVCEEGRTTGVVRLTSGR